MLAQFLTEIVFRLDPMEINDLGSYGFPDLVGCQDVESLPQGGMRKGSTGNNRPVITKHIGLWIDDRIPSTTPGAEPPRDAKDSGSARPHSTHLETSSTNRS